MHAYKQQGVTLMEPIVAMAVLSIGLLGIIAMDAFSIRKNHEAFLRTQVILQVQEMADRMHANLVGVDNGDYASAIPGSQPSPNCLSANCTPTQMAAFDKWEWNSGNAAALPQGAGTISQSSGLHTITVTWYEEETTGTQTGAVQKSFSFVYKPMPLNLI